MEQDEEDVIAADPIPMVKENIGQQIMTHETLVELIDRTSIMENAENTG